MNARLFLVLALLLVSGSAHAQEVEPAWLEVANTTLNLRSGPSTDDSIITRLTPREAVELLEQGDQWSRIRRQDGTAGWAHNDYLLPWDERNRPDTWRRIGDRRLFRLSAGSRGYFLDREAELSVVSDHSYVYTVRNRPTSNLPGEKALQDLPGSLTTAFISSPLTSGALRTRPTSTVTRASSSWSPQDLISGGLPMAGTPPALACPTNPTPTTPVLSASD